MNCKWHHTTQHANVELYELVLTLSTGELAKFSVKNMFQISPARASVAANTTRRRRHCYCSFASSFSPRVLALCGETAAKSGGIIRTELGGGFGHYVENDFWNALVFFLLRAAGVRAALQWRARVQSVVLTNVQ
jgi:hypothetical protein